VPDLWLSFFRPISARFRRRRFAQILRQEPELLAKRIPDLGGSVHFWQKAGVDLDRHDITILNIAADATSTDMRGEVMASSIKLYDGSTIPWSDQSFDWVISNSVVEHVPPSQGDRFCSEICRVGRNYLVQTPAFPCPIEPHLVMPFLHWLPRSLGRLVTGFGLWGLLQKRRADTNAYFDEVNLLTLKDVRSFFPGADLSLERFAGFPKSYSLIGRRDR
jgi:Methyltransferase domain